MTTPAQSLKDDIDAANATIAELKMKRKRGRPNKLGKNRNLPTCRVPIALIAEVAAVAGEWETSSSGAIRRLLRIGIDTCKQSDAD